MGVLIEPKVQFQILHNKEYNREIQFHRRRFFIVSIIWQWNGGENWILSECAIWNIYPILKCHLAFGAGKSFCGQMALLLTAPPKKIPSKNEVFIKS